MDLTDPALRSCRVVVTGSYAIGGKTFRTAAGGSSVRIATNRLADAIGGHMQRAKLGMDDVVSVNIRIARTEKL